MVTSVVVFMLAGIYYKHAIVYIVCPNNTQSIMTNCTVDNLPLNVIYCFPKELAVVLGLQME